MSVHPCQKVKVKFAQLCPTLWDPKDYTVHEILQARILEWVAFPFSRGYSQLRDRTDISHIAGGFFTSWATRYWYEKRRVFYRHRKKAKVCHLADLFHPWSIFLVPLIVPDCLQTPVPYWEQGPVQSMCPQCRRAVQLTKCKRKIARAGRVCPGSQPLFPYIYLVNILIKLVKIIPLVEPFCGL